MTESASSVGKALAELRKRTPKLCVVCGKQYEGLRQSIYCSHACASTAYWDAHREELNRKRRERYQRQKKQKDATERQNTADRYAAQTLAADT